MSVALNFIRSLVFNILFFLIMFIFLFSGMILLPFDRKYTFMFWHCLSTTLDLLTQYVIGITYKIEKEGEAINAPAIYAVRHEST